MVIKIISTCLLSLGLAVVCQAQSNTYPYPATGNIGLGTTSPVAKLDIQDSRTIGSKWLPGQSLIHLRDGSSAEMLLDGNEIYGNHGVHIGTSYTHPIKFKKVNASGAEDLMTLTAGGMMGMGTATPLTKIHLETSDSKFITLSRSTISKSGHIGYGTANGGGIYLGTDDDQYTIWMQQNGRVGIGTTNPQAKLSVNGNILAKEVKIKTDISVPDYVFEPDYELLSLSEIEAYVREHRHLPEIPSGIDIRRDGLDLAVMNLLLLKKIEELTLHLIELDKENEVRKQWNNEMGIAFEELKAEVESLRQRTEISN